MSAIDENKAAGLTITLDEMMAEIDREISKRRFVFEKQVGEKKLSADTAARRIEILKRLRLLAEGVQGNTGAGARALRERVEQPVQGALL